jgi:ankyrin repeat protein
VSGSYDAVRYLLALGANVNAINLSDGFTPIHQAIRYIDESREVKVIHKLLVYGARLDIKDSDNDTPANCLP